jgi:hypothetical protein
MHRKPWVTAALAAVAITSTVLAGPEWVEKGDAGSLPTTAQRITGVGSLTRIHGTLEGVTLNGTPDLVDAYILVISEPTTLFATTVDEFGGMAEFDSALWLMTTDGFGLLGNDDTSLSGPRAAGLEQSSGSTLLPFSTDGTGIVITEPGEYLLCISLWTHHPFSDGGSIYSLSNSTEISGPDGPGGNLPVTGWFDNSLRQGGTGGNYTIVLNGTSFVEDTQPLTLAMDIKPGGCPNSFNRTSNGVLPVSILGTPDFSVHSINKATVRLSRADGIGGQVAPHEGPPGPKSTYEDTGTPFAGGTHECDCHAANGDGVIDLSMKFKTQAVVDALLLNDIAAGALVQLKVTGELTDGTEFQAFDCVRLVPPGTPPGLVSVSATLGQTWIDASPLDLTLDGGGFGNFARTYPQSTVLTLTAPQQQGKLWFHGWRINGNKALVGGTTLTYTVNSSTQTIEAVYGAPPTPNAWSVLP